MAIPKNSLSLGKAPSGSTPSRRGLLGTPAKQPREQPLCRLQSLLREDDGLSLGPWIRDQPPLVQAVEHFQIDALPGPPTVMEPQEHDGERRLIDAVPVHGIPIDGDRWQIRTHHLTSSRGPQPPRSNSNLP